MNRGFSFLNKIRHLVKAIRSYLQMLKTFLSLIILFFLTGTSFAQFGPSRLGIAINAVYTTSAEIFLNPNASNIEIRNKSFTLENIWDPGMDIRYKFSEEFILGLNVEYINKTANAPNLSAFIGNQVVVFEVQDGLRLIPIELTFYYYFPFSTEDFKFLMGGGLGYYRGEFIRKFSDVELDVVQRKIALGIHVSTSMDYMINEIFSARFEMKFRNPQYNVKSKYSKTELTYQGNIVQLPEDAFETKVDIDGLTFILGIVINF
jgi:outer membrane protein W